MSTKRRLWPRLTRPSASDEEQEDPPFCGRPIGTLDRLRFEIQLLGVWYGDERSSRIGRNRREE